MKQKKSFSATLESCKLLERFTYIENWDEKWTSLIHVG